MKKLAILLSIIAICLTGCITYTPEGSVDTTGEINVSFSEDGEQINEKPSNEQEHEHGKIFAFQPQWSTAMSYIKPFCEDGKHCYLGYTLFRGTPNDLSYLEVIEDYSDGDEIIGGEYYTVSAIVILGDYDINRTRVRCRVQSENIIVDFSVEFREEFEEVVSLLDEDDKITFRGRFYDEGCGWTDCELIVD
jgi:hypothetical protein